MPLTNRPVTPGVLAPRETMELPLVPPLAPGEQPILLTAHAGCVVMKDATPDRVLLENVTDGSVVFLLLVVPSFLVRAAATDWGKLWREGAEALQRMSPEEAKGAIGRAAGMFLQALQRRLSSRP